MHRLSLDDDRKGGEGERENGDDDGGNGNGNDLTPTWLTSTGYGCVIILRKYEEIDRSTRGYTPCKFRGEEN